MGLQYVTPTGWADETVMTTLWSDEVVSAATWVDEGSNSTAWYDECLWKEFTFGSGVDEEYRDDIDEISPTVA
ncbi:MAG: hypothetical protein ACE5D6_08175 [Candidatus Zixiibacteriota bacterium]